MRKPFKNVKVVLLRFYFFKPKKLIRFLKTHFYRHALGVKKLERRVTGPNKKFDDNFSREYNPPT